MMMVVITMYIGIMAGEKMPWKNFVQALVQIFQNEGFAGLYRGTSATVAVGDTFSSNI